MTPIIENPSTYEFIVVFIIALFASYGLVCLLEQIIEGEEVEE